MPVSESSCIPITWCSSIELKLLVELDLDTRKHVGLSRVDSGLDSGVAGGLHVL